MPEQTIRTVKDLVLAVDWVDLAASLRRYYGKDAPETVAPIYEALRQMTPAALPNPNEIEVHVYGRRPHPHHQCSHPQCWLSSGEYRCYNEAEPPEPDANLLFEVRSYYEWGTGDRDRWMSLSGCSPKGLLLKGLGEYELDHFSAASLLAHILWAAYEGNTENKDWQDWITKPA